MKLSLKLKTDILALAELVQRRKSREGTPWSDTKLSHLAMGYGDFISILRKWDGGPKSPTMEKVAKLELFLRDQITEEEYEEFIRDRARESIGEAAPEYDSFND